MKHEDQNEARTNLLAAAMARELQKDFGAYFTYNDLYDMSLPAAVLVRNSLLRDFEIQLSGAIGRVAMLTWQVRET